MDILIPREFKLPIIKKKVRSGYYISASFVTLEVEFLRRLILEDIVGCY